MAIDWAGHFRRIEAEIAAGRRVVRGYFKDLSPRDRRASEALWIRALAASAAERNFGSIRIRFSRGNPLMAPVIWREVRRIDRG